MTKQQLAIFSFVYAIFTFAGKSSTSFAQTGNLTALYNKAVSFQRVNTDSALIYIDSAFLITRTQSVFSWKGKASLAKSKIHLYRGEVDLSIEYALMARNFYSKDQNKRGIANSNLILAQGYSAKSKKKSESCLKEAEKYAISAGLLDMQVEIILCRGNIAFQFHEDEKAMTFYREAEQRAISSSNLYLKTKIQNNIANILVNTGRPKEALPIYKKALIHYKKLNHPLDELLVLYNIGRQYRADNQLDSSLYYCNLCLDLGQKVHSLEDITYAYSAFQVTYEMLGNFEMALKYNELMHVYADSLQMNANNAQILRLESDYQLRENEKEIERQNKKLNRSKKETTAVVTALSIAVFLILLGAFYYRKSRKLNIALQLSNSEILEKNKTVDKALYEKEILLKEVHHRVKNSLQIISSLLNLQESQLTDEIAIDALRNSKTRIQTIALMHQSLYQKGADLAKVDSAKYLDNILKLQLEALSNDVTKPETRTLFVDQELSIDQAVPVGLIATEIISNALKHAYSEQQEPILIIQSNINGKIFELKITDNGKGFETDDFRNHSSLGLEIVEALTSQLHGEMKCESNTQGTTFTLFITVD